MKKRVRNHQRGHQTRRHAELPPPVAPPHMTASTDVNRTQVEHGGDLDWNEGAAPDLRIVGWPRP
jgi:hypothetical protein